MVAIAQDASVTNLPATEMARRVRAKEMSPVELVETHLRRIEQLNPKLNAYVELNSRALEDARRVEAAVLSGQAGPLVGVPVSVKSCIDVAGLRCAAGSKLRQDYVAASDAPLVARLKRAGAIVLGNTNTPEFLMAYHTDNAVYGRTNHPRDLGRTPGGSSGGEAAAIAACMSAGGIGSDGGGSIRVPAHFSGICGLKPTPGRVPATGHYPPCGGPFSLVGVVGPMARTIADLKLILSVIAGYDAGDPVSADAPTQAALGRGTPQARRFLRVAFYEDDGYSAPTTETRAAVRTAGKVLQESGFAVEPFRPAGLDRARELWATIFVDCTWTVMSPSFADTRHQMSADLREYLEIASARPALTGERLLSELLERDSLRGDFLKQMERFPILLAPVCAIPAFRHEDAGWGPQHAADYFRTMTYSQHYNLLGLPAAVVPVGRSPEGLPIGVQVIGRPWREDEVLDIAEVIEKEFGYSGPQPLRSSMNPE